jgi:predicted nucleic acid-binding protein
VKEYVLGSNAVLRYLGVSAGQGADKVRALFAQAERGQARLSMSVINLGEVLYILLKHVDVRPSAKKRSNNGRSGCCSSP